MPVRALLLDGFGTLLDWSGPFDEVNENALRRAHAEADGVVGLPPFTEFHAVWRALRDAEHAAKAETREEMDFGERFKTALDRLGASKRQVRVLAPRMALRYFRELEAQVRLAPDAAAFLRAVPEGVKLALVANYGDGTTLRTALDRLGIYYRLDVVVVSADPEVRRLKPHPLMFETALRELDVPAEDALMVGDNPALDVDGAHALGIRAALVANPRADLRDAADRDVPAVAPPAIAVIGSLGELPALIEKLA